MTLPEVPPGASLPHASDSPRRDAMLFCKCPQRCTRRNDRKNSLSSKARIGGCIASHPAPLRGLVCHVVVVGPEEQVVGVYARRIVAMVANKHSVGDRAVRQNPREPMSAHQVELAVPVTADGCGPYPTPAQSAPYRHAAKTAWCDRPCGRGPRDRRAAASGDNGWGTIPEPRSVFRTRRQNRGLAQRALRPHRQRCASVGNGHCTCRA